MTPSIVSVGYERGLANCPAMRATFTTGTRGGIAEHHRHLQQHLHRVAQRVGVEFGERFRAVAGLQQERLAGRDTRKLRLQRARLAGEDQRWCDAKLRLDSVKRRRVRIDRRLRDRAGAPVLWCPGHGASPRSLRRRLRRGLRCAVCGTDGPVITSKSNPELDMRASFGERPLLPWRNPISDAVEMRKPPWRGGFGFLLVVHDPRPPVCTSGTKIARRK